MNQPNILGEAYGLGLGNDRESTIRNARRLAGMISIHLDTTEGPLVSGEEGVPRWDIATQQLVGRSTINPIAASMLAGVIAAGVAAAHERVTGEPVSRERELHLRDHLITDALCRTHTVYNFTPDR